MNEEKNVIERLGQVYRMNLNLPFEDKASRLLYDSICENMHINVIKEENILRIDDIPINDILNVIIECHKYCLRKEYDVMVLSSVMSVFDTFSNLKYISLTFKSGTGLLDNYKNVLDMSYKGDKSLIFNEIYDITEIEIAFANHFDKEIVDTLNEILMFYGYLENDYLKRKFTLKFDFDEYTSFMEMVFKNNIDILKKYGSDFINYLIYFPVCITDKKPKVRILTNYSEL